MLYVDTDMVKSGVKKSQHGARTEGSRMHCDRGQSVMLNVQKWDKKIK